MSDYRPVDCDTHSRYEEAVLLRRRLRLCWRDTDDALRDEIVQPLDVVTREGEEFLLLRDRTGREAGVRLDRILSAETLPRETT